MTRLYRLYDNEHWMSYTTLKAAVWDLCVKLHNLNCMNLLHMGQFEETEFMFNKYHKQYVIRIFIPYTVLKIKKMTKGDIDQDELINTLVEVEKLFNERIQSKD